MIRASRTGVSVGAPYNHKKTIGKKDFFNRVDEFQL
jgi:hypothetical protein